MIVSHPERIITISNFVDERALVPLEPVRRAGWRERFGIPDGAMAVGCVSRLAPVKNFAALLSAVAALRGSWPDLHVLLIGDGACRAALEQQTIKLGLSGRVHITGLQAAGAENLQGILDIVVLPSISEGFPNAVVEAMAARVPVIATDVGGVPDVVVDRVTGLLIPAEDPDALAGALDLLLRDHSLRQALADAGRARVAAMHTAAGVVGQTQALYLSLLQQRARPHRRSARLHPCLTHAPCTISDQ